jgi:hypothetical protein
MSQSKGNVTVGFSEDALKYISTHKELLEGAPSR